MIFWIGKELKTSQVCLPPNSELMLDQQTHVITAELISSAQNYSEYREMIDRLLAENKTTGINHSESYLDYTKMNVQRMNRWDKTAKISPELEKAVASISSAHGW